MFRPRLPSYDIAEWRTWPFEERVRAVCGAWALQGYGSPPALLGLYALKIAAYVAGWIACCTLADPSLVVADIGAWWSGPVAFHKAIVWTMLFEGLGLGCGSGPLTGRYVPPVGGALYFLRPGTVKLPLVRLPWLGNRRTVVDVVLYAAVIAWLTRVLAAPEVTPMLVWPILVAIPVLGVLDRTLFLVFRSEHYLSVLLCIALGPWIAGSKVVWMAIWWWAATSKLNAHFPAVVCVMTSNSPWVIWPAVKRAMYRKFPDDLRPSRLAAGLAHFGTGLEYLFPLALLLSDGGPLTTAALVVMAIFHLFILLNVPMGVPLEWNVMMMYGAAVLFGAHADVSVLGVLESPALAGALVAAHLVLPIVGSVWPQHVSFLLAMRYYAGNWATSVWLFEPEAVHKLDAIIKWSDLPSRQLGWLYDPDTIDALLSKVVAFRCMHVHGRAVLPLANQAVPDLGDRLWLDGELVAGMVVGWNFGEGHLHGPDLLAAIQERCGFAEGELRVVFLESQPIHRATHDWVIADAATGVVAHGRVKVADLLALRPGTTRADAVAQAR